MSRLLERQLLRGGGGAWMRRLSQRRWHSRRLQLVGLLEAVANAAFEWAREGRARGTHASKCMSRVSES